METHEQAADAPRSGELSRREFFVRLGQTGTLILLGAGITQALESCGPNNPVDGGGAALTTIQASAVNGTVTIGVGAGTALAAVGSAALVQYGSGSLLVAHTGQNAFTALSAICTHQGCLVSDFSGGEFVCPCHGSHFSTSGQVTAGPAPSPLAMHQTTLTNNQLVIRL